MAGLRPPEADVGALRAPMRSCLSILGLLVLLLLALALLERLGIGTGRIPITLVVVSAGLAVAVALLSHGRRSADFYAADGRVVARLGGLAIAGMLAGALLISADDEASAASPPFIASASGLLLGIVLSALLIAPRLRRAGGQSPGDFFAARFGAAARLSSAIVACAASLLIVVACARSASPSIAEITGLAERDAMVAVAILAALAVIPGGMRALTWTQLFQYFVMALACLVPAAILAFEGGADAGADAGRDLTALFGSLPNASGDVVSLASTFLLFAGGTAVLPPLLARVHAAPSPQQAASSLLWSLLFVIALAAGALVLADGLAGSVDPAETGAGPLSSPGSILVQLPAVLAGLVMAGVLSAILSLAQAALFSASSAVSRDTWQAVSRRPGREGRRILAARLVVIAAAAAGGALASAWPLAAPETLAWALAMSVAGSLAPLAAGLLWRRCTAIAAVAGMLTGFAVICLVLSVRLGLTPAWVAPDAARFGPAPAALLGTLASLVVTIGASLARFRSREIRDRFYGAAEVDATPSMPEARQ